MTARLRDRRMPRLLLAALLILLAAHALVREFDADEIEHVHSAWYLACGCVPYEEFFEHHHPLLWAMLLPILRIAGEQPGMLIASRLLMLAFAGGILLAVAWTARELALPSASRRLAVLLLVSQIIFFEKVIEIRPDVPSLFFGLIGVACWLRGVRRREPWLLAAAGAALGLSFVVLQKAALVALAAVIVLAIGRGRTTLRWRDPAVAGAAAVLPVAAFMAWVAAHGIWPAYVVSNWLSNASAERALGVDGLWRSLSHNPVFWFAAVAAAARWGRGRASRPWLRRIIWLGVLLFVLRYVDRRPNPQDLLWSQTLLAIPAGHWLACVLRRTRTPKVLKALLAPLAVVATLFASLQLTSRTNTDQLARVAFVLEHTRPDDAVYDGVPSFNVFRRDIDFYWFALLPGSIADTHARLTGRPNLAPRLVETIVRVRPAIARAYLVDGEDPRLARIYRPSAVDELYERVAAQSSPGRTSLARDVCWR
jgi:hypothetical protein